MLVVLLTVSAFAIVSYGAWANQSAQDGYGYYWVDSNSPEPTVTYNWIEIAGTGTYTSLSGDDTYGGPYPIGFSFDFYGNSYSAFNLSTNGFLQFDGGSSDLSNDPIPSTNTPNNIVAACWDDLYVPTYSLYYQTFGNESDPDQYIVIEYYNVYRYSYYYYLTFEIILHETGEIWFQYQYTDGWGGDMVTVGIEDSTGELGTEYSYNQDVLYAGLAIMFDTGPIGFTPYSEETASWDATAMHTLMVRNGQAFTDSFDIEYTSMYGWTVTLLDSSMFPLDDNNLNGFPDTGDLLAGESTTIYVLVDVPASPTTLFDATNLTLYSYADPGVMAMSFLWTETFQAQLGTTYYDYGDDTDSDGDFDYLMVDVELESIVNEYVYLSASLNDAYTNTISYSGGYWLLPTGTSYVTVGFSGEEIFTYGADGPYFVDIYLYDYYGELIDTYYGFETYGYLYDDFDPPAAYFAPPHSDSPVDDDDSNTQYDALVVSASVAVEEAGIFVLEVNLHEVNWGTFIEEMSVEVTLDAGLQTVDLIFDAMAINLTGLDGPYVVYMDLYTEIGDWLDFDLHYTATYLADEFEGPRTSFVEPPDEATVDSDGDTLYNSLVVTAYIECFETDTYVFEAGVYDPWYNQVQHVSETLSLTEGTTIAYNISVPSKVIYLTGISGNWYFDMHLWDSESEVENDNSFYTTSYYYYYDFDPYGAYFGTMTDSARDTDSDGYYNEVVVNVTVDPVSDGDFVLHTWVYDYYGGWDMEVTETVHLEEAVPYYWEIVIPGYEIYVNWLDSPFYLDMDLRDEATSYYFDYESYNTAYYYPGDFDPVGATIGTVTDEGVDTDADGYYNGIVLTVPVDADPTWNYSLGADVYVYNYGYYYLYWVEDAVLIEEGVTYYWEIVVSGEDFVMNGLDGQIYIEMYVFDEDETVILDSVYYYSDWYYLDEFDPVGAYFEEPYADYGRDDDGNGLYDWLVMTFYVNASSDGYYDIWVYAQDYYGYFNDEFLFSMYLLEGERTMLEVAIPSNEIQMESYYGGYWYFDMYAYDAISSFMYDYGSYGTSTYYYPEDFDPLGVELDYWIHDDYGDDWDSDILYDYLVLEIGVYCYEPGEYTVEADLYLYGWYYASVSETRALSAGNNVVTLMFEGWKIYNTYCWYDYFEVELTAYDAEGMVQSSEDLYTNNYYVYDDFEGPPAWFYPPHTDEAVDDDGDLLYDYLTVDAAVYVTYGGVFWVYGELRDADYDFVDGYLTQVTLVEGVQHVELSFDAWLVENAEYWPYYVLLTLYDAAGSPMDTDTHYLSAYDQDDFDPSPPLLESGWAYESPSVDGSVDAGEWFGATEVGAMAADSTNEVEASMYVMNNATHLFVLMDATGDLTESVGDGSGLAFDTWNDEYQVPGEDDMFVIESLFIGTLTTHYDYDDYCAPFDPTLSDHEGLAGALGFGPSEALADGHRVYEFCIPLALVDASMGEVIGLGARLAYDAEDGASSTWPVMGLDTYDLDLFGDLLISEERPLTTLEITGDEGLEGWFVSDVEVSMVATGGTGGVANTSYNLDGQGWQTYSAPFDVAGDGIHTLQYYSTDMAGNAEPVRTFLVMIDTVAPVASVSVAGTEGLDGWVTANAVVTFEVTDESSGLAMIMYRMDGGEWTELTGLTVPVAEDGSYELEFYAVDVAGHEGETSTYTVKVDLAAPTTTATVDGSDVTLVAVDGNGSGVSVTMYRIDGGDWVVYNGEFEVRGSGDHTLEYYSVDEAGLNETVKTVIVKGATTFSFDWWMVILILALIAIISIGFIFGMRKKATRSEELSKMNQMTGYSVQMLEESPPQGGQQPPQGEEPPPPPR